MPNFLVIGAGNAGTTSLYYYLKQHPDVYMSPVKEPKYFALEGGLPDYRGPGDRWVMTQTQANRAVTDLDEYRALFSGARGEKAVGEASPAYLCNPEAPERIKRHVPDARLIAVLRDPAERAYSAYMHQVRDGRETLGFAEALDAEEWRTRANWAPGWRYTREGFYYGNLSRYFELFGGERIKVGLYEDLVGDPAGLMRDFFRFLGVEDSFEPDTSRRHNPSGVPKSRLLVSVLKRPNPLKSALRPLLPAGLRGRLSEGLQRRNLSEAPPLEAGVRGRLVETYREDVLALEGLIGRDLSAWLR
jgi:hypothetical protein